MKILRQEIERNNDYLVPENFIKLCMRINNITDSEMRNTMLQLLLLHANEVVVSDVSQKLKEQWLECWKNKDDLLVWSIANYVYG